MNAFESAKSISEYIIKIRRIIHQNPEPSWHEFETSKLIAEELHKMNISVRTFEKPGVIGDLIIDKSFPTVALRADIDALSMIENTDLPFCSTNGFAHTCGHDTHIAMLLGAAKILSKTRDKLSNNIRFIFQPAEEMGSGAEYLIEQGALKDVDFIFGMHNLGTFPSGKINIEAGPRMAAVDVFYIEIEGTSCHGAQPQFGNDAIVATSAAIMNLQTIISRNIDPNNAAVVTVGTIEGGDRFNIIADRTKFSGTTRTFSAKDQSYIRERIREIVSSTASMYGCNAKFKFVDHTLPVVNNPKIADYVRDCALELFGEDCFFDMVKMTAGEDFCFYLDKVPGAFAFLGGCNPDKQVCHPIHSPLYNFDEEAMLNGTALFVRVGSGRS